MRVVRSFLHDRQGRAAEGFLMGGCVLAFLAVVATKSLDQFAHREIAARQTAGRQMASDEAARDGVDRMPTGSIDPHDSAPVVLDPCKGSVAAAVGLRP